jgi:RNA polymerase sigma factor (sigma-70 family)
MARYPTDLVTAASAGDRRALCDLLAAAQPDIRRYARRSCRSISDAEDAVQETLFVLYRHLTGLRQAGHLSTWLFTIVRRQCQRLSRAMLGTPVDPATVAEDERLMSRSTVDLRIDVANAIQSLPDHYRQVVLLRDINELTIDEIAGKLGLTRESAKARLHRARHLLREYLAD